ncbi:MAG: SBBP repeat-containing protein [Acidimicrobiales bacterium]
MGQRAGWFRVVQLAIVTTAVTGAGLAGMAALSEAVDGGPPGGTPAKAAAAYDSLPISFAPNRGQAGQGIDYVAQGVGYGLALRPTGAVLALTREGPSGPENGMTGPASSPVAMPGDTATPSVSTSTVSIDVLGADPAARAEEQGRLSGRVNYLTGDDPQRWHSDVPTFGRVTYRGVYPGIDLAYYGNQQSLEYDFIVAPGSDPGRIGIGFQGADSLSLTPEGDLVVAVPGGELRQHAPRIYQEDGATRSSVAGRFVLQDGNRVGFEVADFDRSRPLVIDPVLGYSTFLGGKGGDFGQGIAVDGQGNAYVTGATSSANFPTTDGAPDPTYGGNQDGFVTKLDPDGNLVYSTFLGGAGRDDGDTLAVDASGAVYVRGITTSPDFPVTSGAFDTTFNGGFDAWVAKLSPDGTSLGFSTFLGGRGFDSGSGLDIDADGSAYVVGITGSTDFPITPRAFGRTFHCDEVPPCGGPNPPPFPGPPGDFDAYATKFTPDGSALAYSTFLGGSRLDAAFEVAVDPSGRAAVAGVTLSPDFPTTPGAYDTTFPGGPPDAWVARLAPDGRSLAYSTFLGGSGPDGALGLDVEASGAVHVSGGTSSPDFPTTPGAYDTTFNGEQDAYVAKLSPNGSTLRFSTFLGGARFDASEGLAIDGEGASYVIGETNSSDFPTTPGAHDQTFNHGGSDAFVTKLNSNGTALADSTFLGGTLYDYGSDIAVGPSRAAYVTGLTRSPDFPTTPGAFDPTFNRGPDAFVTKLLLGK